MERKGLETCGTCDIEETNKMCQYHLGWAKYWWDILTYPLFSKQL